ncbi:7-carboxy-7-deazaguanine synthase QueE, partial [Xanthomonas translucens]
EPLAQKRCLRLLEQLCDAGYDVSLETSGALDIADVDPRVSRVLDIKTPASQEAQRNRWENLPLLTARDQIKFVLCGRADYDWARAIVAEHRLHERCTVWFSPSKSELAPRELADWIVADRLPVRFQMQLHKLLWNDEPGR